MISMTGFSNELIKLAKGQALQKVVRRLRDTPINLFDRRAVSHLRSELGKVQKENKWLRKTTKNQSDLLDKNMVDRGRQAAAIKDMSQRIDFGRKAHDVLEQEIQHLRNVNIDALQAGALKDLRRDRLGLALAIPATLAATGAGAYYVGKKERDWKKE